MGVRADHWIEKLARQEGMIEPFESSLASQGLISFGISSYGYDFRLSDKYKLPRNMGETVLDPKNLSAGFFSDHQADHCIIPPNSFVLGHSLEYFRIPRNVLAICTGKSTYARCGVLVNVTPFEPEWEGHATVSISNTGALPVKIYSGEGIAQLVFLAANELCQTSYGDRKGKYQAQRGIVLSRIQGSQG